MPRPMLEALKLVPVFRTLDPAHLEDVAGMARRRIYASGEMVVRQGDQGDSAFVIERGFLKVCFWGPSGSLTTLSMMGAGEIFGELSLLDGEPRSATVTAISRTELVVIDRAPFLRLVQMRPQFAIALMEVMAGRLRRLSERSDDLAGMPVGTRSAKQLLLLAQKHGQPVGPSRLRLGIKLSQRELGELVGATRESINKHLRFLSDEHIIEQESGYLLLTNLELLRSMAER